MNIVIFISQKFLLSFSFLTYLFLVWRQGKENGFNKSKILDLGILSLAFALTSYLVFARLGFRLTSIFLLSLFLFIYFFSRAEGWSILKIGDIFARSLSLAAVFFPYFPHPLFNFVALLIYLELLRIGSLRPRTGFIFLGFLALLGFFLAGFSFFSTKRIIYGDWGLSLVCLIISVLGLRAREYQESMALLKYTIPSDILQKVKDKLLQKRQALEGQERNLSDEERTLSGPVERSAEEQDQALTAGEKVKNENLLNFVKENRQDVDAALKKIEAGNYGLCEKCGQPIDKSRLMIFPEAHFCFNCEPKEELGQTDVTLQ